MSSHRVEIQHQLPPTEVHRRLVAAAPKLESQYGARCQWSGDRELRVVRAGLEARVSILEDRIAIALELGLLLRAFRDKIVSGISRELGEIVAASPAAQDHPK